MSNIADPSVIDSVSALAEEIRTRRLHRLEAESHKPPWKPRRHYASMLNGCARQLVYAVTAWEQKEPFTAEGVAAMQDGSHEEKLLIAELVSDGFDVIEQQVQIDDDRYWITGKIDGKLKWQGAKVPFEIKRLKPFVFERITTVEDFKFDPFLLKYLRQLQLYLFMHSQEAGLFIVSDGLGKRKVVVVPFDYELTETVLKDLDTANAVLKVRHDSSHPDGLLPDRIPYDSKVCGYCPWKTTCLPQVSYGDGAHMADPEIEAKLARYLELKPLSAEQERLKKELTLVFDGKPIMVSGKYIVTGKQVTVTPKPQTTVSPPYHYWKWEVEALKDSA